MVNPPRTEMVLKSRTLALLLPANTPVPEPTFCPSVAYALKLIFDLSAILF
jgi:hypothetical protein